MKVKVEPPVVMEVTEWAEEDEGARKESERMAKVTDPKYVHKLRQDVAFLFQVLDNWKGKKPGKKADWRGWLEMVSASRKLGPTGEGGGGFVILDPETAETLLLALDALGEDIER